MSTKIKVEVINYRDMMQGIYCGWATVRFVEGDELTIPIVNRVKIGDIIELYESESK